jgi:hypothetical protein
MRGVLIALGLAINLAGCATTGPQMIGKDTFMVSAKVPFDGESGAKAQVLRQATASCETRHLKMMLVTLTSHECALHGGCGEAEITYQCLLPEDPRYK